MNANDAAARYREVAGYLPDAPKRDVLIMAAIYNAWDHYGPSHVPRIMGSPEAARIYDAIRAELMKKAAAMSQGEGQ